MIIHSRRKVKKVAAPAPQVAEEPVAVTEEPKRAKTSTRRREVRLQEEELSEE